MEGPSYCYFVIAPIGKRGVIVQSMKEDAGYSPICLRWSPKMSKRAAVKACKASGYPWRFASE